MPGLPGKATLTSDATLLLAALPPHRGWTVLIASAQADPTARVADAYGKLPLSFAANRGQAAGEGGNDPLLGGSGNDGLDGGIGTDTCQGQADTATATTCESTSTVP